MADKNKSFPTSVEVFKKIKGNKQISSSHIVIGYLDRILNKNLEKRFSSWKDINNGGDIPWHRVYYFKYKDKIIWDRNTRYYGLNDIISPDIKLEEKISILSYNILDNDSLEKRKEFIVKYLSESNADIICLQEVNESIVDYIREREEFKNYEITTTDLKINNIMFLTRQKINNISLINLNSSKQALKIVLNDQNDNEVQFIGIHLTSDHQSKADEKRKIQLDVILKNIDKRLPAIIIGDFNITDDNIPQLEGFIDVTDNNKKESTYDPHANQLAKENTNSNLAKRYDRIYFNKNCDVINFIVRCDILFSDHYPIECSLQLSDKNNDDQSRFVGDNKNTSLMLIIKNDDNNDNNDNDDNDDYIENDEVNGEEDNERQSHGSPHSRASIPTYGKENTNILNDEDSDIPLYNN